jgi:hypothetical protein
LTKQVREGLTTEEVQRICAVLNDKTFLGIAAEVVEFYLRPGAETLAVEFLKRLQKVNADLSSEDFRKILEKILEKVPPDMMTEDLWEYLRPFPFTLPAAFAARITNWRVPDYLCLIHPEPEMVIPEGELQTLYLEVPKTHSDYEKLFAYDRINPVFRSSPFWLKWFAAAASDRSPDFSGPGNVFRANFDTDDERFDALVEILKKARCIPLACRFAMDTGCVGHRADEIEFWTRVSADLLEHTPAPSHVFWRLHSSPAALVQLLLEPTGVGVTRRYDIYHGLASGLSIYNSLPPNIPPLAVLPQTSNSLAEVVTFLSQPYPSDLFELPPDLSEAARSLIVAAHLSALIAMIRAPPLEITGVSHPVTFLALSIYFIADPRGGTGGGGAWSSFLHEHAPDGAALLQEIANDPAHASALARPLFAMLAKHAADVLSSRELVNAVFTLAPAVRALPDLDPLLAVRVINGLIVCAAGSRAGPGAELVWNCVAARPILEWLFESSPAAEAAHLDPLPLGRVAEAGPFLCELAASGLTLEHVRFAAVRCSTFPMLKLPGAEEAIAALLQGEQPEDVGAVARFAVHCGCTAALLPFAERPEVARAVLTAPEFAHEHATAEMLIASVRSLKAPCTECLPLLQASCITGDALIGFLRTIVERAAGQFALKVESLFGFFPEQYARHPLETCTAVLEVYAVLPGVEGMLMHRPALPPLRPLSPINQAFIEGLLRAVGENPEFPLLVALRDLAGAIPFAFGQLSQFSLADVAELCLNLAARIGESIEGESEEGLRIGAAGLVLLTRLSSLPAFLDAAIPRFLEGFAELVPAKALVVVILLRALLGVPTVQLVLVALMVKFGFAATLTGFLEGEGKLHGSLISNLLALGAEYFKGLNMLKAPTEAIAAEVAEVESPFTKAFGGGLAVYKIDDRYIVDPPSLFPFLRDVLKDNGRIIAQLEAFPKLRQDPVPRFHLAAILENLRIAARAHAIPELELPLPPSISPDGYRQLPENFKSILLYHTLPPVPRELTPAMHRRLLSYPPWVSQYVRHSPSLMLLPEHYLILHPILTSFSTLSEDDTADICLLEFLQIELINTLVRLVFGPHRRSAAQLITEIGRSFPALDAILSRLSEELARCSPERMRAILELLESMKTQADFGPLFGERIAPALLSITALDPLTPRSELELVARATALCTSLGQFPPQVVHALAFLLVVDGGRPHAVNALQGALPPEIAERVAPYVRHAFDGLIADFDVRTSPPLLTPFIQRFEAVLGDCNGQLLIVLDRLLTDFHAENMHLIGALCSRLAPGTPPRRPRAENGDVRLRSGLSIPDYIRETAPAFWEVIERHGDTIDQLIDNVNEGRLFNELKFLTSFPEVLRLKPKISLFRSSQVAKISREAPSLHVSVRRSDIVNDSYAKLGQLKGRQLLVGFHVTFRSEGAIDAGGVTRDWFASLLRAMFNPNYALFQLSANNRSSQINPASPALHANYKEFYRFVGRMLARAVIEGVTLDAHMTRSLLKHLLGMPMRLKDLEEADEELYTSLQYVLDNDPEELCLTFQAHVVNVDQVIPIDLIDNGRNIVVTVENRQDYVNRMVEHHLTSIVREQVTNFCQGFHDLISPQELSWFTPDELDLLICGLPEVDVEDLRSNCRYVHPFHANHAVIQMFFRVLEGMTAELKAKFLIFLTGSSQVPVGGFAALTDLGRPVKIAAGGDPRRGELPRAHTCWNQLDLPPYDSEEVMREKLLMAIQMCDGFGFA